MLPFSNIELIGLINKIRPVKTPILSRHFNRTKQATSNAVQIDVIEGPEGLMVAISWDAESRKAKGRKVSTKTITLPRFSEHDFVTGLEQLEYRRPGMINGPQAFAELVAGKYADIKTRIDRTKEFMAIKALQGQVVDGDGNVLATYPIPAAIDANFSTENGADVFDDAAIAISRALGYDPSGLVAYAGATAYKRIRNNPDVQKILESGQGTTLITTGKLPMLSGVEVQRIVAQYVDNDGNPQNFLGENDIIIASADGGFQLIHAPCLGKGGKLVMLPYYADQNEIDDPPATKIRAESNPLPVVNRPEAVYRLTATG